MPIHVPGKRDRRGHLAGKKRSVVAILSLTAMVDMFTVLVVFLLQNYAVTGEVLEIPEGVDLPQASQVKELKPTNVVIVSPVDVMLNNERIMTLAQVKNQQDWLIEPLKQKVEEIIRQGEKEKSSLTSRLKNVVENLKTGEKGEEEIDEFRRMTIQADKQLDFLTLKKIMYSVTEGGVYEINFAVLKEAKAEQAN